MTKKQPKEKLRHGSKHIYTKQHWLKKEKRKEKANIYPAVRKIKIKHFITSPDTYIAAGLFLMQMLLQSVSIVQINNPEIATAASVVYIVLALILVIIGVRVIRKRQFVDPTRRKVKGETIIKSVLLLVTSSAILTTITLIIQSNGGELPTQSNQEALRFMQSMAPLTTIINIVVIAPLVEELVFRELMPYVTGPSILSFVAGSAIFALLHSPAGITGMLSYGSISAVFLYARLKDNNIYSSIIVHGIWNTLAIAIMMA